MSFAFGHYFFPGRAEARRCFEINILIFVVNLLVFFVKHLLYLNIHAIAFRCLIQILQFFAFLVLKDSTYFIESMYMYKKGDSFRILFTVGHALLFKYLKCVLI